MTILQWNWQILVKNALSLPIASWGIPLAITPEGAATMSFRLTSRRRNAISAFLGTILAFDAAYAASGWAVHLDGSSKGGATKASTVQNLVITPTTSGLSAQLYPGGTSDVALQIKNLNPFPVSISGLVLPFSTTYASGITSTDITGTASTTCTSTTSGVSWTKSQSSGTTPVTFAAPIDVAANTTFTVTLTGAASMNTTSDNSCQGLYFVLPSLSDVTALAGGTSTSSPSSDSYS